MTDPGPLESLLKQPLPPGNVRITLDRWQLDLQDVQGVDAFIRYRDPAIDVQAGSEPKSNGLNVFAIQGDVSISLGAGQFRKTTRTRSSQFILLTPGSTAWMDVIKTHNHPGAWDVNDRGERGVRVPSVSGSMLRVGVERADQKGVEVRLEPFFRSIAGKGGWVRVDALQTRIVLKPGIQHVIMASKDRIDTAASAWLTSRSGSHRSRVILVMRADVGRPVRTR